MKEMVRNDNIQPVFAKYFNIECKVYILPIMIIIYLVIGRKFVVNCGK